MRQFPKYGGNGEDNNQRFQDAVKILYVGSVVNGKTGIIFILFTPSRSSQAAPCTCHGLALNGVESHGDEDSLVTHGT